MRGDSRGFQLLQHPALKQRPGSGPHTAAPGLCPGLSLSTAPGLLPHLHKEQVLQQAARRTQGGSISPPTPSQTLSQRSRELTDLRETSMARNTSQMGVCPARQGTSERCPGEQLFKGMRLGEQRGVHNVPDPVGEASDFKRACSHQRGGGRGGKGKGLKEYKLPVIT